MRTDTLRTGVPEPRPNSNAVEQSSKTEIAVSLLAESAARCPADQRYAFDNARQRQRPEKAAASVDRRRTGRLPTSDAAPERRPGVDVTDRLPGDGLHAPVGEPDPFEQWLGRMCGQGKPEPRGDRNVWSRGTLEVAAADKIA